jgi:DNA-binding transcriptional ArsR family regulator
VEATNALPPHAHPVRLRLVRTLTRSSHTTSELAFAWDLTAPEVSRHLAVLRRAGLLTTERRGRYVHYSVDLLALTALGADLLAAMNIRRSHEVTPFSAPTPRTTSRGLLQLLLLTL